MRRRAPHLSLATILVLACAAPAAASPAPDGQACRIATPVADPLADRAGLLAQYERLPRPCQEQIFRSCSAAAGRTLLDLGTAAMCSINYEALLKQGFGGDFRALMAWWNADRSQATAAADAPAM